MSEQTKPTTEAGILTISIPAELKDLGDPRRWQKFQGRYRPKWAMPHEVYTTKNGNGKIEDAVLIGRHNDPFNDWGVGPNQVNHVIEAERAGRIERGWVVLLEGEEIVSWARAADVPELFWGLQQFQGNHGPYCWLRSLRKEDINVF